MPRLKKAKKAKPAKKLKKSKVKMLASKKKSVKKVVKKAVAKRKKSKKVAPIPKGFHTVTPYLIVNDCANALTFYKEAFGAKAVVFMALDNGKIGHAEMTIGDSKMMIADEHPSMGALSPSSIGGSPITLHLYVKNVDAFVERAVAAGAKLIRPVEDMFYGDRSGGLEDPYGYKWYVATHIEDLSDAVIKKRAAELYGNKC